MERDNFFRLCALLMEEGTKAVRRCLTTCVQTEYGRLTSFLASKPVRNKLHDLERMGIVNAYQRDILYPNKNPAQDTGEFDITLLTVLHRVIVELHPNLNNRQAVAIREIKKMRNECFAHTTSITLTSVQFSREWNRLEQLLVSLNVTKEDMGYWKTCNLSEEQRRKYLEFVEKLRKNIVLILHDQKEEMACLLEEYLDQCKENNNNTVVKIKEYLEEIKDQPIIFRKKMSTLSEMFNNHTTNEIELSTKNVVECIKNEVSVQLSFSKKTSTKHTNCRM